MKFDMTIKGRFARTGGRVLAVALLALASSPFALAQTIIDFDAPTDYSSDTPDAFGNLYVCGNNAGDGPGQPPCLRLPESGPYDLVVESGGKVADAFGSYYAPLSGDIVTTGNSATVETGGAALNNVVGSYAYTAGAATATDNHVNISGTVAQDVNGSLVTAGTATATDNDADVSGAVGGSVNGSLVSGATATAESNSASVSGTANGNVSGGNVVAFFGDATATNNDADVSGAVGGSVYGSLAVIYPGYDGDATAEENTASVSGTGTVGGSVYGGNAESYNNYYYGFSGEATATGNKADVENGGEVTRNVYGGRASGATGATADGNTANVAGKAGEDVTGGVALAISGDATATNNSAAIKNGGEATGSVRGGEAESNFDDATATGNDASVAGKAASVFGGTAHAPSGEATATYNDAVVTSDGEVSGDVTGGRAEGDADATATDNTASVSGRVDGNVAGSQAVATGSSGGGTAEAADSTASVYGTVGGDVFGGKATNDSATHGFSGEAKATGNSADVKSGGEATSVYGGYVTGDATSGVAEGNTASVTGKVTYNATGGFAEIFSGNVTAEGNKADVENGGEVDNNVYGGQADAPSGTATVTDNSANVATGGNVAGDVYGGRASGDTGGVAEGNTASIAGAAGYAYGGDASSSSGDATATDNSADVATGGAVTGGVYGGYANGDTGGVVERNRASIAGAAGYAYGGDASSSSGDATATDNSANVATGGNVAGTVIGGRASGDTGGVAEGNSASIAGTADSAYGGRAVSSFGDATAKGNSAEVATGGAVTGDVYGGYAEGDTGGVAEGNTASIAGAAGYAYGGDAYSFSGDATAKGNSAEVASGGEVTGDVYGGYANGDTGGVAEGNTASIAGAAGYAYGGYAYSSSGDATATGNTVSIEGTAGYAYGGAVSSSGDATATNNSADVATGGAVTGGVYGGYANGDTGGVAERNRASIAGAAGDAYGGYAYSDSGDATATGNTAVVSGGVSGDVYGGYADSDGDGAMGKASGNEVLIDGGTVGGSVYGGFSLVDGYGETGEATGNTVTVQGSARLADVYGGFVGVAGAPDTTMDAFTGNTLNKNSDAAIASASNFENVNFGYTGDANIGTLDTTPTGSTKTAVNIDVGGNDVTFTGADKITGDGGIVKKGAGVLTLAVANTYTGDTTVEAGTLEVTGSLGDGDYAGAIANDGALVFDQSGDQRLSGTISGNGSLAKKGAGVLTMTGENTYAGGTTVSDGTLQIGEGGTEGSVVGDITNDASVVFNRSDAVAYDGVISGIGSVTKEGSGVLTMTGENTYTGGTAVNDGTLQIGDGGTKGSVKGDIDISDNASVVFNRSDAVTYGGVISGAGSLTKKGAGVLTLSGRSDNYTGATTVEAGGLNLTGSLAKSAVAVRNGAFLDLKGLAWGVLLDPGATLNAYDGGGVGVGDLRASGAGSTMNFFNTSLLRVGGDMDAKGATMNFFVPSTMGDGGTMVEVAGAADVAGSTVNVGIAGKSSPLGVGDRIALVDARGGLSGAPSKGDGVMSKGYEDKFMMTQGVTLKYDFNVYGESDTLYAEILRIGPDARAKALSEGYVAELTLLNQGADFAAGRGIGLALERTMLPGWQVFASSVGGGVIYDTGSSVDLAGYNLMVGAARSWNWTPMRLTAGLFYDLGRGGYDTYNSFADYASVRGGGDVDYQGGGAMLRADFRAGDAGSFYVEGTGRAGVVRSDFGSGDLRDYQGVAAAFESEGTYYGMHLGAGYVARLTGRATLDLYGKYLLTRREGDEVALSTGETVRFAEATSVRARSGGRLNYLMEGGLSPYLGAAWEREFDGEVAAFIEGFDLGRPTLAGDSGMYEAGVTFGAAGDKRFSLDLGVQGYSGRRVGITGSARLNVNF